MGYRHRAEARRGSRVVSQRPHMPIAVKREVLARQNRLCACGCGAKVEIGCDTEFDHNPALSRRRKVGRHYVPAANDPVYIDARRSACHDRKTYHPRGPHTSIGGDIYEARKTVRLKRGTRKGKRRIPSTRFAKSHRPITSTQWRRA